ncbi:MAG: hypothetical protein AB8F95_16915, partial [Bacteroidia bacterium]
MAQKGNGSLDSKLEAIKDIIFGEEKANLEERLTALEESTNNRFGDGQTALVDFRQEIEGRLQRLEERIINQHNETLELIKTVKAEKADRQSL